MLLPAHAHRLTPIRPKLISHHQLHVPHLLCDKQVQLKMTPSLPGRRAASRPHPGRKRLAKQAGSCGGEGAAVVVCPRPGHGQGCCQVYAFFFSLLSASQHLHAALTIHYHAGPETNAGRNRFDFSHNGSFISKAMRSGLGERARMNSRGRTPS